MLRNHEIRMTAKICHEAKNVARAARSQQPRAPRDEASATQQGSIWVISGAAWPGGGIRDVCVYVQPRLYHKHANAGQRGGARQTSSTCPTCRVTTNVPNGKAANLAKNFSLPAAMQ
jgi:hypothetical protein